MENHIAKLIEATDNMAVSYRYAYNDGPDIGVRGYNVNARGCFIGYDGCRFDTVIVDGITWLIAGDIYNVQAGERVSSLSLMGNLQDLDVLRVNLRAHAFVLDKTISVDLGSRRVAERVVLENDEGVLYLQGE